MPVTLTNLINEVMPDVIGCPFPLVEAEVKGVLADFCGSTGIISKGFKKDILSTDPTPPNGHIDITTPAAMALYVPCDILWMYIDGVPYEAKRREINDALTDMDLIEEDGVKFWYPSTKTNIVMYPFKAQAAQLYLQVAFKPSMAMAADTVLEDMFYENWHKYIVSGVKASLMAMPKKAWTAPAQLVAMHKGNYDKGVNAARIAVFNTRDRTVSRSKNQFL